MRAIAAFSLLVLVACAPQPVSRERAVELCQDEAHEADGVSGRVIVGGGSGGAKAKGSITVTDRVLNPQTEDEYVTECVDRRVNGRPAKTTVGITIGAST